MNTTDTSEPKDELPSTPETLVEGITLRNTLYNITAELLELQDALTALEGDATGQEELVARWFTMNREVLPKKMDGYGSMIRENEFRALFLRSRADAILQLARRHDAMAELMRKRAVKQLTTVGIKQVDGEEFVFKVVNNGGSRPIKYLDTATGDVIKKEKLDAAALPDELRSKETVYVPNAKAFRKQLEDYLMALTQYRVDNPEATEEDASDNVPRPEALKYAIIEERGQSLRF